MIPHCDISTGKIYGCKPESKKWYHEKGHFEFNKMESTSRLLLFKGYALSLWMFFVTLSILLKVLLVISIPLMLVYLFIEFYEEAWCNAYANQNYKVLNKDERR